MDRDLDLGANKPTHKLLLISFKQPEVLAFSFKLKGRETLQARDGKQISWPALVISVLICVKWP